MEEINKPKGSSNFLEGCVDTCDVNGDMIVKEYTFPIGGVQWDPKVL